MPGSHAGTMSFHIIIHRLARARSESLLTPASLSSSIAEVVDLTNRVKTISSGPAASGGLSDIYKGVRIAWVWERMKGTKRSRCAFLTLVCLSNRHNIQPQVAIKVFRILTIKDRDDPRARKVNPTSILAAWVYLTIDAFTTLDREVYVCHRLEHPNVVKIFRTSYHMGRRPAMVMRWY